METWAKFHLHSMNSSENVRGKWCGMPAPPEHEVNGRPVGARTFWEDSSVHFFASLIFFVRFLLAKGERKTCREVAKGPNNFFLSCKDLLSANLPTSCPGRNV